MMFHVFLLTRELTLTFLLVSATLAIGTTDLLCACQLVVNFPQQTVAKELVALVRLLTRHD